MAAYCWRSLISSRLWPGGAIGWKPPEVGIPVLWGCKGGKGNTLAWFAWGADKGRLGAGGINPPWFWNGGGAGLWRAMF